MEEELFCPALWGHHFQLRNGVLKIHAQKRPKGWTGGDHRRGVVGKEVEYNRPGRMRKDAQPEATAILRVARPRTTDQEEHDEASNRRKSCPVKTCSKQRERRKSAREGNR